MSFQENVRIALERWRPPLSSEMISEISQVVADLFEAEQKKRSKKKEES